MVGQESKLVGQFSKDFIFIQVRSTVMSHRSVLCWMTALERKNVEVIVRFEVSDWSTEPADFKSLGLVNLPF